MRLQHLLSSAAMASLILMAPEMCAMKKTTSAASSSQDAPPSTPTMKKNIEEKVEEKSSSRPQEKEKKKEKEKERRKEKKKTLSSSSEDEKGLEKEAEKPKEYTWSNMLTNQYFAWTATTEIEMEKFPEITPSTLLQHMQENMTLENVRKILFGFTTGTLPSSPNYYDGYAFVDGIDYGTYRVAYLKEENKFDSKATYMSQVKDISPLEFINDAFIKAQCNEVMCKVEILREADAKTRLIYIHHNESDNKYLRLVIRREKKYS